jgi:hypothetical protein
MTQIVKPAFSAGKLSAELTSSVELEKHRYGLKESLNMIVDALGGMKNRPGTQYIDDVYSSTIKSRLIPFKFNVEQAYMLEFSNLKMRILKDGALVGAPTEVVTPYATADLSNLEFTQSADTLYVFHPDHSIREITRTSDTVWTVTDLAPLMNGPYRARIAGDEDTTIHAFIQAATLPAISLQATTGIFADVEVGDCIKFGLPIPGDATALFWRWGIVTNVVSSVLIDIDIEADANASYPGAYEQIVNPRFENGLVGWTEKSSGTNSRTTYDFTNETAKFTQGSAGSAILEQAVLTHPNLRSLLRITISSITGSGSKQLNVSVGTTPLGTDILAATPMTAATTYTFDILPTTEIMYVSFDSVGSVAADVIEVSEVSCGLWGDATGFSNYYTNDWRLGAWNATLGYPERGVINEQRLMPAGSASLPQTIWPSKLGAFRDFDFSTPGLTTDSFSFNPPTPEINGINWLSLFNGLKVGTADAIWDVFASSGGSITPTDVNIRVDGAVGSLDLQPIVAGNSLLVTPRGMAALSEITSSFETSGFVPRDVSILARDLFENRRIVRWAFAKSPDSVIWCVLDDGVLLGFTYVKEYDIWAWHKHTTPLGEGFMDVSVVPNSSDDNIDDVYFVINRAEAGATANYYLETLNKRITPQVAAFGLSASGTPHDYKFLDSALTLDSPTTISGATQADPIVITATGHPFLDGDEVRIQNILGMTELNNNVYTVANKAANTFELTDSGGVDIDGTGFTAYLSGGTAREMVLTVSGLDHLEGQSVMALADGAVRGPYTVSSGAITLDQTASFVNVGLAYTSEIETVDLEIMADDGTTQGKVKSITKAEIYFKDSRGAEFSTSNRSDTYAPLPFNDESEGEEPPDLFTGSKEIIFPSNYGKDERIKIRQTEPLPLHIKRIIPDVSFGG